MRLLLLVACAITASPVAAQSVRGIVVDAGSGEPVPNALIRATSVGGNRGGSARSGQDGRFVLNLRASGTFRLQGERTGYATSTTQQLTLEEREMVEVELRLSAAPLTLEPLTITARVAPPRRRHLELNGFYRRERMGNGRFLRREEIERHTNQNLAQILSRVPGTAIHYQGTQQYIYFPRNGRPSIDLRPSTGRRRLGRGSFARAGGGNSCLPRLFMDGMRIVYDASSDINSAVSPEQIEAIEVFRGPSEIPAEYYSQNPTHRDCGVILIWTRREN
jgi:hypothetical protein